MSLKAGFSLGGVKKPGKLGFGLPSRAKPKVPIAFAADSDDEDGGATRAGLWAHGSPGCPCAARAPPAAALQVACQWTCQ